MQSGLVRSTGRVVFRISCAGLGHTEILDTDTDIHWTWFFFSTLSINDSDDYKTFNSILSLNNFSLHPPSSSITCSPQFDNSFRIFETTKVQQFNCVERIRIELLQSVEDKNVLAELPVVIYNFLLRNNFANLTFLAKRNTCTLNMIQ